MCSEPSRSGNYRCILEVDSNGEHKGGHVWVLSLPKPNIEQKEGES